MKSKVAFCIVLLFCHSTATTPIQRITEKAETYFSGLLLPPPLCVTSQQKQTGVPGYKLKHSFLALSSSTLFASGILLAHGFDVSP